MKHIVIFVVLLTALVIAASAQPKFSLDKSEVDLGVMYNGNVKSGSFTITNIGNKPLHIISLQPTCGCTALRKPKSPIAPNQSEVVEIEFNATGYRTRTVKHVNIETNDPTAQYVTLKVVADVREELSPVNGSSLMWFGTVPVGKQMEQSVEIKNVSDRPIRIKNVSSLSPQVKAKVNKKTLNPSEVVTISVSLTVDKEGYTNHLFTLETDSKNQPKIDIKVSFIGIKAP